MEEEEEEEDFVACRRPTTGRNAKPFGFPTDKSTQRPESTVSHRKPFTDGRQSARPAKLIPAAPNRPQQFVPSFASHPSSCKTVRYTPPGVLGLRRLGHRIPPNGNGPRGSAMDDWLIPVLACRALYIPLPLVAWRTRRRLHHWRWMNDGRLRAGSLSLQRKEKKEKKVFFSSFSSPVAYRQESIESPQKPHNRTRPLFDAYAFGVLKRTCLEGVFWAWISRT